MVYYGMSRDESLAVSVDLIAFQSVDDDRRVKHTMISIRLAPAQGSFNGFVLRFFQCTATFCVVSVHQCAPFTHRLGLNHSSNAFGICRKKSLVV
jgi:hypothetical protein